MRRLAWLTKSVFSLRRDVFTLCITFDIDYRYICAILTPYKEIVIYIIIIILIM